MGKTEVSGAEIQELKDEVFKIESQLPQTEEKKLINDGKQYVLKFPKKFIEEAEVDLNKDVFEIKLELPSPLTEEKPKLSATLKRK